MKLLRKRPERRYRRADELIRELAPLRPDRRRSRRRPRGRATGRLRFALSRIAIGLLAGLALTAAAGAVAQAQRDTGDDRPGKVRAALESPDDPRPR